MTLLRNRVSSLFALALMFTLAATAVAAPPRPFKAKGETAVVPGGDPTSPEGAATLGSGTGTHLGKFVVVGTLQLSPEGSLLRGVGTQTFIAANGDTLETSIDGLLDPFTGEATVSSTITGGTGRFKNASGSFETAVITSPEGAFVFESAGTIKY